MTLPASRFASHSIAPQTASACPGTFQHFLVLLTSLEIYPRAGILESYWNKDGIIGRHTPAYWNTDGIISSHDSPFGRLAVVLGPRAHLRQEPRRSSGGQHRTAAAGSRRAYSSLSFRSFSQGHSVLPLPCENWRLSMGFYSDIRANRRFI